MRAGACRHIRGQKNHEQPPIGYTSLLNGDAHGDSIYFGPSVREVRYDSADPVGLIGIVVSSDRARPYLKLSGRVVIASRSRLTDQQALLPSARAVGEFCMRVNDSFEDTPFAVDVDNERLEVRKKCHRARVQALKLVQNRLDRFFAGIGTPPVESQANHCDMAGVQQGLDFRTFTIDRKRN